MQNWLLDFNYSNQQLRAVCLKKKIQIWHSTHICYEWRKCCSNRLIFKDILAEDQCTLSMVSMFPFEGFLQNPHPLTFSRKDVI